MSWWGQTNTIIWSICKYDSLNPDASVGARSRERYHYSIAIVQQQRYTRIVRWISGGWVFLDKRPFWLQLQISVLKYLRSLTEFSGPCPCPSSCPSSCPKSWKILRSSLLRTRTQARVWTLVLNLIGSSRISLLESPQKWMDRWCKERNHPKMGLARFRKTGHDSDTGTFWKLSNLIIPLYNIILYNLYWKIHSVSSKISKAIHSNSLCVFYYCEYS